MTTRLDDARQAASAGYVPEFAAANTTHALPTMPPSPPFLYAFHPNAWTVLNGQLVPRLSKRALQPGVNGVERDKDGRWRISAMRAHAEGQGWRLLPLNKAPNGTTYIKPVKVQHGRTTGTAHLGPFEDAYPGTDAVSADLDGYCDWLQGLVNDGTIPRCPPFIARKLADDKRGQLLRLEDQIAQGNASLRPAATALRNEIAVLDDYGITDAAPVDAAVDGLLDLDGEL